MAAPGIEWTQWTTDELIQVLESCPALWDVTSKEYKNRTKKKQILAEMADKFGKSGEFRVKQHMVIPMLLLLGCTMCTTTTYGHMTLLWL